MNKLFKAHKIQRDFNKMLKTESNSQVQAKMFKMEHQKLEKLIDSRINKLAKKYAETKFELENNSKKLEIVISLLTGEKPKTRHSTAHFGP